MTSNELFALLAPKCAIATLSINAALVAVFCLRNRKIIKERQTWLHGIIYLFCSNAILSCIFMIFGFFLAPTTIIERTVILKPEVIKVPKIIKEENIIEVPSIMLPLTPEGSQAVLIDTTSIEIEPFMRDFYGENVYFFNNRQDATFLLKADGVENYSGLDISQIEYCEISGSMLLQLDELGFETIWLFSNLSHIELMPTNCNVILYSPCQLNAEQITKLKANCKITIISVETID